MSEITKDDYMHCVVTGKSCLLETVSKIKFVGVIEA
jgi:hypothetical protein